MGIFNKKRDDYKVKIDEFYGPLDLLVHLIENAKMSIYDINISEITDQYIAYLKAMKEERYDVEVEFLVLASTLIELKSMMILSRKEENVTKEELYEDLEARLISYKRVKIIASMLSQKYMEGLFHLEKPTEDLSRFNKVRIFSIVSCICSSFQSTAYCIFCGSPFKRAAARIGVSHFESKA